MPERWDALKPEQRAALELGNAAMETLKRGRSIERWHAIGVALNMLQAEAMVAAGTNVPIGKRYNDEWNALAKHVPHLRDMDKPSRSHSMWMATNWDAVNKWLETLPVNQRLRLNHPTAIRRRYDAANKVPEPKEAPRRIKSQDQIIALQEENDRLRQGLQAATPEELGDMICDIHGPVFVTKLILHLREKIR